MRKFFVLALVLTGCLVQSWSQLKVVDPSKVEVFGGYSYSRAYVVNGTPLPYPLSLNGGQASGTYFPVRHFGFTGEFAGYTDNVSVTEEDGVANSTIDTQGYLFGPTARFGLPNNKFSFFVNQLFGVTHFSFKINSIGGDPCPSACTATTNAFTMATGGGFDIKVSKHFSVRPAQLEYFTQQINLFSLDEPGSVHASARPLSSNPGDSLKISTNGFRFSAGGVFHF